MSVFWCVLIRAGALGGQKHQLQAIVSLPVWVLRARLKFSVTLICALNWWAISTPHSFAPASHGLVIWLQFCCGNLWRTGHKMVRPLRVTVFPWLTIHRTSWHSRLKMWGTLGSSHLFSATANTPFRLLTRKGDGAQLSFQLSTFQTL